MSSVGILSLYYDGLLLIAFKDMGLGKTLTTLALILSSLDSLPLPSNQILNQQATISTLIITPLSCMCLDRPATFVRLTCLHSTGFVGRADREVSFLFRVKS